MTDRIVTDMNGRKYVIYEPPAPEVAAERTRLRDYFAARALQGLLSNPHYECGKETSAQDAYRHADAMLKARKVQP